MVRLVAIPPFTSNGVLPPYTSRDPVNAAAMAPYCASMVEVTDRFGSSLARLRLLDGLLQYRAALTGIGLVDGFQWLDGSFMEQIEITDGHDPRDIDVVTFCRRPPAIRNDFAAWQQFVAAHNGLFLPLTVKLMFSCDAYLVDLDVSKPASLVDQARYWFGLFSHKRVSSLWKGLVQIPLGTPAADAEATAIMAQRRPVP
jgi:hypothetical protein